MKNDTKQKMAAFTLLFLFALFIGSAETIADSVFPPTKSGSSLYGMARQ